MKPTIEQLLTSENLDMALKWCREQRKDWPVSDAISSISLNWGVERKKILSDVYSSCYTFEPVKILKNDKGKVVSWIWHARDAILLKALSIQIQISGKSFISNSCCHIKGHGGLRRAVQSAGDSAKSNGFVFKSDIEGFYESINHNLMLEALKKISPCGRFMGLMEAFLKHDEEYGGLFQSLSQGISKSCPLSPVLGAIYLFPLDSAMKKLNIKYIRFMDDWLILAKKRWHLRKAIKICNQILNKLKLKKHPNKTFIGRVTKKFEFLGFKFSDKGLVNLAKKTKTNFLSKLLKLYEYSGQNREDKITAYLRRFIGWVSIVILQVFQASIIVTPYIAAPS
jgi:hypothetical protein